MSGPLSACAAVDLGATSGRVTLGLLKDGSLELHELHRFENRPIVADGVPRWDVDALFAETLVGLCEAVRRSAALGCDLASIGVDSWGVDYALLDEDGSIVGPVLHHRGAPDPAAAIGRRGLDEAEVYAISGVPDQAINTALRLAATAEPAALAGLRLLFIPDLWTYLLTGELGTEPTIASTSQLLAARRPEWAPELIGASGLAGLRMPAVSAPGSPAGRTSPEITARIGASAAVPVHRVAGHDTASAFAFAPPAGPGEEAVGLVSSGTWSVVGLSLREPVLGADALDAGFTNERGIAGTLFVRNLNGMWLLDRCVLDWSTAGTPHVALPELIADAAALRGDDRVFDVSEKRLLAPGPMVPRVAALCAEAGRPEPRTPAEVARAVVDSLAAAYRDALRDAARLAGVTLGSVRIVGGGSLNRLLCGLTADATGLTVVAGPTEASSVGNIAVQLAATGRCATVAEAYERLTPEPGSKVLYRPRAGGDRHG